MNTQPGDQTSQQLQEEGQITEESKQTTKAKGPRTDAGWAWVVLCGAFVAHFSSTGFTQSLSVYLPVWIDYWETNATTTSLVISINALWRGLMSPIASALCTRFGPRVMTIVGGVVTAGGLVLLSLSPSITVLILVNLIPALGVSFVFVSAMQVLGLYFHKRYTLAVGLSLAGISSGQLALPPLITFLIDRYGWKGSVLITAAITLHIAAAGALMRPVSHQKRQTKVKPKKADESTMKENESQQEHQVDIEDKIATDDSGEGSDANCNGNSSCEIDEEQSGDKDVAVIIADSGELINDGNAPPIEDYTSILVAAIEGDGLAQVIDLDSVISENKPTTFIGHINLRWSKMKHFLLEEYGLRRLMHNSMFMLLLVVCFFYGFGNLSLTYIVARAASVDIDLESAALLLSSFGVGGLIGRVGPGWFIDKKYISVNMAYVLGLAVFCVSLALMPAFVDFGPLAVLAAVMGVAAGTAGSLGFVLIRSLVRPCDATEALGIMLVFMAIGRLTGNSAAGLIYDNTESYDVAFFTGAAILLVATLLAIVLYVLHRANNKPHLPTARFWAKLPRKNKFKNVSKSASFEVNSKLASSSQNGDLGLVNPLYTRTECGVLQTDAVTTNGDDAKVHVEAVNPLFESVETPNSKENTREASETERDSSYELPTEESCPESQSDWTDSHAVKSAAILPSSTTPLNASHCVNLDFKDLDISYDGSESGSTCSLESITPGRGFDNTVFDVETPDAV